MARRRPVADRLQCQLLPFWQTFKVVATWDIKVIKINSNTNAEGKKIITEIQTRHSDVECQLSYRKYMYQILKV